MTYSLHQLLLLFVDLRTAFLSGLCQSLLQGVCFPLQLLPVAQQLSWQLLTLGFCLHARDKRHNRVVSPGQPKVPLRAELSKCWVFLWPWLCGDWLLPPSPPPAWPADRLTTPSLAPPAHEHGLHREPPLTHHAPCEHDNIPQSKIKIKTSYSTFTREIFDFETFKVI